MQSIVSILRAEYLFMILNLMIKTLPFANGIDTLATVVGSVNWWNLFSGKCHTFQKCKFTYIDLAITVLGNYSTEIFIDV